MRSLRALFIFCCVGMILSSCGLKQEDAKIHILDIKTSEGIDEKYMPVNAARIFPASTSKVFCWFSWNKAQKEIKLLAKWHYLSDDLAILDYTFAIPRKEGMGSVSLAMPEGKTLPPGLYRVSLELGPKTLKTLTFKVSEAK